MTSISGAEPTVARPARARSRSRSTSASTNGGGGGNQRLPNASVTSAPALGNGRGFSESVAADDSSFLTAAATKSTRGNNGNTATAAANSSNSGSLSEQPAEKSVEHGAAATATEEDGGGGVLGKEDVVVEVGMDGDMDVEAEAENVETGELVAAEAEKWVGGVAVGRIRSLSSMYRSEEGSQFQSQSQQQQQQLPRSRTASTSARQEKEEMGIEGGKDLPPELVVAEDQEVCGLAEKKRRKERRACWGLVRFIVSFGSFHIRLGSYQEYEDCNRRWVRRKLFVSCRTMPSSARNEKRV